MSDELIKLAGQDALTDRADLARIGAALGPGIYSTPQVLAEIRRLQRRITDELEPLAPLVAAARAYIDSEGDDELYQSLADAVFQLGPE